MLTAKIEHARGKLRCDENRARLALFRSADERFQLRETGLQGIDRLETMILAIQQATHPRDLTLLLRIVEVNAIAAAKPGQIPVGVVGVGRHRATGQLVEVVDREGLNRDAVVRTVRLAAFSLRGCR